MTTDSASRQIIDNEHLRLLAIFHYIKGGLIIAFSCFLITHLSLLSFFISQSGDLFPQAGGEQSFDPEGVMTVLSTVFAGFIALGVAFGAANIISGRLIKKRQGMVFSHVIAVLNCLSIPYGTILGIFTFMVLGRPSVRDAYNAAAEHGVADPESTPSKTI